MGGGEYGSQLKTQPRRKSAIILWTGFFLLLCVCGLVAVVVIAGRGEEDKTTLPRSLRAPEARSGESEVDSSHIRDIPIPLPKSDPTYQGMPASAWAKLLTDHDPDVSRQAGTALAHIGDGAVPYLEPIYRKGEGPHRRLAAAVLLVLVTELKSDAALDAIIRAAQSSEWVDRFLAIADLSTAGPAARRALPILERLLNDPVQAVAETAKRVIPRVKGEKN
jgi:hypothetical protein